MLDRMQTTKYNPTILINSKGQRVRLRLLAQYLKSKGVDSRQFWEAFKGAFVSRGKRKGLLNASCPSGPSAAIWQGLMLSCNAFKVSIGRCIMLRDEERALYDIASKISIHPCYDKDREALEALGAW